MGVVTKGDEGKYPMAGNKQPREGQTPQRGSDEASGQSQPAERAPSIASASSAKRGFFTVYKPGQGYWTRLGTVIGALLVVALVARFVYVALATRTALDMVEGANGALVHGFPLWKLTIVGVLTVGSLILLWWYLNKPSVVDFLIATESEMKKVNWTSRKELIGSTKVVILFVFLIAAALFVIDVVFGYFFYLINVLKTGPFA